MIMAAAVCCLSCTKSEIQTFRVEDCSVSFNGIENSFSLRGWVGEYKDLHIPVRMLGIPVDYDREITLDIKDSIATAADYQVISSVLKAGEMKTDIVVRAKSLEDNVEQFGLNNVTIIDHVDEEGRRAADRRDSEVAYEH